MPTPLWLAPPVSSWEDQYIDPRLRGQFAAAKKRAAVAVANTTPMFQPQNAPAWANLAQNYYDANAQGVENNMPRVSQPSPTGLYGGRQPTMDDIRANVLGMQREAERASIGTAGGPGTGGYTAYATPQQNRDFAYQGSQDFSGAINQGLRKPLAWYEQNQEIPAAGAPPLQAGVVGHDSLGNVVTAPSNPAIAAQIAERAQREVANQRLSQGMADKAAWQRREMATVGQPTYEQAPPSGDGGLAWARWKQGKLAERDRMLGLSPLANAGEPLPGSDESNPQGYMRGWKGPSGINYSPDPIAAGLAATTAPSWLLDKDKFKEHLAYGKIPYTPLAERQAMVTANAQNRSDVQGARAGRLPWNEVRQRMTPAEAAYQVSPTEENLLRAYPEYAQYKWNADAMGGRMEMALARDEAQLRARLTASGMPPDKVEEGVTAWKDSQGLGNMDNGNKPRAYGGLGGQLGLAYQTAGRDYDTFARSVINIPGITPAIALQYWQDQQARDATAITGIQAPAAPSPSTTTSPAPKATTTPWSEPRLPLITRKQYASLTPAQKQRYRRKNFGMTSGSPFGPPTLEIKFAD